MHPNAYLKTYWRLEFRPQVFVAMAFAPQYQQRYEKVIAPAISAISVGGVPLTPYRVDLSKTGDCRMPQEVLLIRDDHDKFLFDVSVVPHKTIDFTDETTARTTLTEELLNRFKSRELVNDARVQMAAATLGPHEARILKQLDQLKPGMSMSGIGLGTVIPIGRLLDRQLVQAVGRGEDDAVSYNISAFGKVVARIAEGLPRGVKQEPPTP